MNDLLCSCGHSAAWSHYRRSPGNGQKFDALCLECFDSYRSDDTPNPWHEPADLTSAGVDAATITRPPTEEEQVYLDRAERGCDGHCFSGHEEK